jgi:osmoprotectant transport system ATP-binding protein
MIQLQALTKSYPGQATPAVDALDLDVPEGEIVVLVGPSGCGKTTTLEMINRLVEPTSGRIILDGEDVTDVDVDQLRRRIGYAIQQIGLFPHRTIADNVATVPRMLGWDKDRIATRVDELLSLVGLDPDQYRARYPKMLSGGQKQRVGVARAMAADPPVMLMDEPFGATDPITRDRLQREFLRIQQDIGKTIVFVTHDIDEAITLGDRIAILREGAGIAQYAPPSDILAAPANDFVADFLGSGTLFRRLDLSQVGGAELTDGFPILEVDDDVEVARRTLSDDGHRAALVVDRGVPSRAVDLDALRDGGPLRDAGRPSPPPLGPTDSLSHALQVLLEGPGWAPVLDEGGRTRGVLDLEHLHRAIATMKARAEAEARDPHHTGDGTASP